ncbi:hypothetical protein WSM22_11440 [Cytophagales bacterium WSM2-2]|nr:hypothetical protein WSM22_11440 [Cytophagales bacterium WSM2-2]
MLLASSCNKKTTGHLGESNIENSIFDNASRLTTGQKDSLFQVIKAFETDIGSRIIIVTTDSLGEEEINEFTLSKSREVQGTSDYFYGVLIVVSSGNQETRILFGQELKEGIDGNAVGKIISEDMMPSFRKNNFSCGLKLGIQKIKEIVK